MILHDHDSERSLLGAALIDPRVILQVGHLEPADFHDASHAVIWQAVQSLQGYEFDAVQVKARVVELGGGERAIKALRDAEEQSLSAANAMAYANTIRDRAQRRRYVDAAERIAKLAQSNEVDTQQLGAEVEAAVFAAAANSVAVDPRPISKGLAEYFAEVQESKQGDGMLGLPTGIQRLDAVTRGLRRGSVTVVAGRPGLGKSTLADQIAGWNAEHRNVRTLIFNLEMAARELAPRQIARRMRKPETVALEEIRSEAGMLAYNAAVNHVSALPIDIDDRPEVTIAEIRTQARRHKLRHPDLGLIIIDYLQLVRSGLKRAESREREVAHVSRNVKVLAKELDLPVVLLSQLSREVEKEKRRPQLSDLRESGAVEQDADMVLLIHHDAEGGTVEGDGIAAELIVAKNRKGGKGFVPVWFRREWSLFQPREVTQHDEPQEQPRRFADKFNGRRGR